MKTVKFFYAHTTQDLEVPDDTPVLTSNVDKLASDKKGIEIVREAMEHPIDSPRLSELARGKKDCVIIISDHTRPVPSRDILPNILLAAVMGGCVFVVGLIGLPDWATLLIQVVLGAVLYAGLSAATKNESYRYLLDVLKNFRYKK